ncbi:hypothetical protein BN946_scf184943.g18 [Trametes cinnabarina]|uniref:Uncharacterized protein n=1 Tax=Pycnoporus cinnabarinus TaxID=5643 RepID=A0A060SID2_PYCCI|nr:hypothetical protein BN946_scf184943.g18 [Trametes cinnabarina]
MVVEVIRIVTLCERRPEGRVLELRFFDFDDFGFEEPVLPSEPVLYALLTVAARLPTLEYLYLIGLQLPDLSAAWSATTHRGQPGDNSSRRGVSGFRVSKAENMSRLLSDLGCCSTLCSLRLDHSAAIYALREAFSCRGRSRAPLHPLHLPAHFVKALARTLYPGRGWGAPPLPALERLQIIVHTRTVVPEGLASTTASPRSELETCA